MTGHISPYDYDSRHSRTALGGSAGYHQLEGTPSPTRPENGLPPIPAVPGHFGARLNGITNGNGSGTARGRERERSRDREAIALPAPIGRTPSPGVLRPTSAANIEAASWMNGHGRGHGHGRDAGYGYEGRHSHRHRSERNGSVDGRRLYDDDLDLEAEEHDQEHEQELERERGRGQSGKTIVAYKLSDLLSDSRDVWEERLKHFQKKREREVAAIQSVDVEVSFSAATLAGSIS